ncbi:unnamed protein product [Ambrosiozyma monospora]|uniref:Unnamed protein product n=1 Tax=Ambrosiozyma monospora TaxID=43982 RepID=A0A9W7DHJ6_AMBMO|nr:unnamed protein product [Ambrosiozyma monospora]
MNSNINNNNLSPTKLDAIPAPDLNHPSSKVTSPVQSSIPAIPSSPQKLNEEDSPFIDIETFKKKVNTSPLTSIDRKEIRECKDTLSQLINSTSSSESESGSDSEVNDETGSTNDEFHTPTLDRIGDFINPEARQTSSKMDDSKSLDLTKGHIYVVNYNT